MKIGLLVILPFLQLGCTSRNSEGLDESETLDIGPHKQCRWIYNEDALDPFETNVENPSFDAVHNPVLHVSRRGLTVRIVGTLKNSFLAKHGNDIQKVVSKFPYLTPISQTAIHEVTPDNPNLSPQERNKKPQGKVVKTTIKNLPPNSVMIVYPASIAANEFNTLAGNHLVDLKTREKANNDKGPFGNFPFISYSAGTGHAMHGPITGEDNVWRLKRGRVSHGCNRMQGEHIVELSVLLRCGKNPGQKLCPDPTSNANDNEKVVVMEEFDFIPKENSKLPEGEFTGNWGDVLAQFEGVDVDFPRLESLPQFTKLQGKDGFLLEQVLTKREPRDGNPANKPFIHKKVFTTWNNMKTPFVKGINCR